MSEADRARLRVRPRARERSLFERGRFVALDGEGMTIGGRHRYVLLMSSNGEEIHDAHGITTVDALDLLLTAQERDRYGILVCYGASYDVNMMLRDVPRSLIVDLWEGREIRFGPFLIRYRPRRSLDVRQVGDPEWVRRPISRKWQRNVTRQVTLWDVLGFFQSPFVDALHDWMSEPERAALDLDRIERGKRRRSQFAPSDLDEICAYTAAELRALLALMERLRDHLEDAGLPIARWDGAGAVAAAMLTREHVKDAISEPSDEIERISQHAYSGGRIEAIRYGTMVAAGDGAGSVTRRRRPSPAVWHYDLRSAYPSAMLDLPALAGGSWHAHEPCERSRGFGLVRLRWTMEAHDQAGEIYPFAFRDDDGDISYPGQGEAWVWWPEWEAADRAVKMRRYRYADIRVLDARCFHPRSARVRPLAFVAAEYERRSRWRAEGRGAEKVLKLGLNSLYGKMAQQIGYRIDRDDGLHTQRRPPFHSLLWAGYVTASTRARLYAAAMERPEAVIMFATDALYVTERLAGLDLGSGLGQWEETRHDGIVVAQSGVYFPLTDGEEAEYSRGFDRGSLTSASVREAWKRGRRVVSVPCTRFVTMGAALDSGDDPLCQVKRCPTSGAQHKVWTHWRTWRTVARDLALVPDGTKRERIPGRAARPDRSLVPTRARSEIIDLEHPGCARGCVGSFPYPLLWRGQHLPPPDEIDATPEHLFDQDMEDSAL